MTKPSQYRQKKLRTGGRLGLLALALAVLPACAITPRSAGDDEAAIRALLAAQLADWNAGALERFMQAYLQSGQTRFASGDHAGRGWDQALARYRQRYPDAAAMGRLDFGAVDIEPLGRDHALAFGRWRLADDGGTAHGLFTLVLARTVDGWKILHDHTSAGAGARDPAPPP